MRISKIFHWLYASVMLMPIFAIGVKCFYTIFNPNAKDSYYGETINQSSYVNVDYTNMKVGNTYSIIINSGTSFNSGFDFRFEITNGINNTNNQPLSNIVGLYQSNQTTYFMEYINGGWSNYIQVNNLGLNITFTYQELRSQTQGSELNNFIYEIEYNDYSYIDNVFYYSVDQINNEPLFSWAQSSFLSQPLLFITNFFGVPSTSPILTILCYWFSISVIWLVFDAVMYFPLLIHRWLDKGVIE